MLFRSSLSQGVHIVTVNDYLAQRDSEWMGKIYNFLGLQVGCITNSLDDYNRKKNYDCDITYGTNSEFGFDYLRDNMKLSVSDIVQRGHNFCIVDEVDSVLIDEARLVTGEEGCVCNIDIERIENGQKRGVFDSNQVSSSTKEKISALINQVLEAIT